MDDKQHLKVLKARLKRVRDFPNNTCPASRHVQMMGEALPKKDGYSMLTEEPEHCAISLLVVVAALYETRTERDSLRARLLAKSKPEGA